MERQLVKPHWDVLMYAHRLTHIDNIPYLQKVGFVHPSSPSADPKYVAIGDQSIIKVREEELHHGYKLSDYIPFYFGPHSLMLYVIQMGYNGVNKYHPDDIVYCVVKLTTVIEEDWDCIFTDGHAVSGITEFFTKEQLKEVDKYVKVEDVYAKFWKDETDIDLVRRKQAELLIKNEIASDFICGYFVYSENAKEKMISMGVEAKKIYIAPEYYF